jgi:hypothetical protein
VFRPLFRPLPPPLYLLVTLAAAVWTARSAPRLHRPGWAPILDWAARCQPRRQALTAARSHRK